MPGLLTSLASIKAITRGDPRIQALTESDDVVIQILQDVPLWVSDKVWPADKAEIAQRYIAAHFLALAVRDPRGMAQSQSIGGISSGWSIPFAAQKELLGTTQYGQTFINMRNRTFVPFYVGIP